jgi:hypothetical protein
MKSFKGPNPKNACPYKGQKCSLPSKAQMTKSTIIPQKTSGAFQSNLMKLQIYSLSKHNSTNNLPGNSNFQAKKLNPHLSTDKY